MLIFTQNLAVQHIFMKKTANTNCQPSEYAFQAEIITILKLVLSQVYPNLGYRVLPEVRECNETGNRIQHLDTLLTDGDLPKYGLKLVVAANQAEFDEHCVHAANYSCLHHCTTFLVNLSAEKKLDNYFGEGYPSVIPAHVIYDITTGSADIVYEDGKKSVKMKGIDWEFMFD